MIFTLNDTYGFKDNSFFCKYKKKKMFFLEKRKE